ncbi:MAG TPA: hypothetical protein VIL35_04990 [Vicinamibacterales bacterium]
MISPAEAEPQPYHPGGMRWWAHAGVFLGSLALVGFQTWPLIVQPGRLVALHHDPWLFCWVMLSVFRNALTDPAALVHGAAFYPQGSSIAYSEPLIVPAAVAGPIYAATNDPLFAYNWTLLLFWALSGWAMYAVAYRLTGRHSAATVSAIVFTICSYRMDYYLEFQMQIVFAIPLAVFFLLRWLERQRVRDLAGLLLSMAALGVSVWYYAIITSIALAVVLVHYAALRWRGWQRRAVVAGALGVLALGLVLTPLAEPYFQVRRELGIERGIEETERHSADLLTYVETTPWGWLYRFSPTRHAAEASLFPGFTALFLGIVSLGWLWRPAASRAPVTTPRRWAVALWTVLITAGIASCTFADPSADAREHPALLALVGVGAWLLLLAGHLREGWTRYLAGDAGRTLDDRDLVRILIPVALVGFLLSLGPYVEVRRQIVGQGPYAWLYPFVLPLHAIRVASRFGVLVVFAGALLAGLGFKLLLAGRSPLVSRAATAIVVAALMADYGVATLAYESTSWTARPPVHRALDEMPGPLVVAEVPMTAHKPETRRMLYAFPHGHYLVNGFSGFAPPITRAIASLMSPAPVGIPSEDELWEARRNVLQSLHPAPHLIVHRGEMQHDLLASWARLPSLPWARRIGTYGTDDLYEISPRQSGVRLERWVSWAYARDKKAVSFRIVPPPAPGIERRLEVTWNGAPLSEVTLGAEPYEATLQIGGPLRRVDANRLTFTCRYRREAVDPSRALIGTTGVLAPVDLEVIGSRHPGHGRIRINGVDEMPPASGYLVAVLGPSGEVAARAAFDFAEQRDAGKAFADFVRGAAPGAIVAIATAGGVEAGIDRLVVDGLAAVGALPSPPRPGEPARAIVGVRGAALGTALDVSGARIARATVGSPPADAGIVLEWVRFTN